MEEYQFFKLQWHITNACNLRCKHCYQEDLKIEQATVTDCDRVVMQFEQLLDYLNNEGGKTVKGHLSVTGGEPMCHPHFFDIIDKIVSNEKMSYSVLTNGSYIDNNVISYFQKHPPLFVQLSLDGVEATHDNLRGEGDFARTCEVASRLTRAGIRTMLSFTAHKQNYREFGEVANIARKLGVAKVWTDRMIPYGNAKDLMLMSPEDTLEYVKIIRRTIRDKKYHRCITKVDANRALQFFAGGSVYSCAAARSLFILMPNGDILPCRRMPVVLNSIFNTSLLDVYTNNQFVTQLQSDKPIDACQTCRAYSQCKGGLKCLTYAIHGTPFEKDPGCWN